MTDPADVVSDATFDTSAVAYEQFCDGRAVAAVEREVVSVTGADALRFLQSQTSQDLDALKDASGWTFVLEPSGRLGFWFRVHCRADDELYLEMDPGSGDGLVARLRRFLLRTDAQFSDPARRWLVCRRWAANGPVPEQALPLGGWRGTPVGPEVAGEDLLLDSGIDPDSVLGGAPQVPVGVLERYRVVHGVPVVGVDVNDQTIPGEFGQWAIDASVSFTKGCYTGQELVARIDSRGGNVPRPLRVVVAEADHLPSVGDAVMHDGREAGRLTSVVPSLGSGHPVVALAPLARSVTPGAAVEILGSAGSIAGRCVEPASVS